MKRSQLQPWDKTDSIEHERLTSLVNSMADGVIAVDDVLRISTYNGAALNILDLNTAIEGKPLSDVLKPFDKAKKPIDINAYIRNAKTPRVDRDLRLHYDDGSYVNIYLSVTPVRVGYGRNGQEGYVLVLRDITHEKSLEEERDEFISVVSHELRTPIAVAEGNVSNAQFIADKSADINEIKKALASAHDQILFLAAMMNDLATLSRAERGKLSVEVEPINVAALIDSLAAAYALQIKEKNLKFTTQLDSHIPPLMSSQLYVREVLQNFITNSLKYTHQGGITVKAAAQNGGVLFSVADTGIGISKSDQNKIFNKFFRSEDFRTRQTGGTGLGLYVTKKLAALLDAHISVESELNHGSTFNIFVPSLSSQQAHSPARQQ